MARKERKGAAEERLEGLARAPATGGMRASRHVPWPASGSEPERQAAERALVRLRPGPSSVMAFVAGLVFLAVVAAAGLWHR